MEQKKVSDVYGVEEGPVRKAHSLRFVAKRIALLVFLSLACYSLSKLTRSMRTSFHGLSSWKCSKKPETPEERAINILQATPLIGRCPIPAALRRYLTSGLIVPDGHNDVAIFIRFAFNNHIYNETFANGFEKDGLPMHVDLPRLKAGRSGGAFWSVFTPCPEDGMDFSDTNSLPSMSTGSTLPGLTLTLTTPA